MFLKRGTAPVDMVSTPALSAAGKSDALPLAVTTLSFRADGRALINDISFTLDHWDPTVVLGHNGAGKSLLLRLLNGLLTPSSGSIAWGKPPTVDARAHQAFVFQRPVMLRRSAVANVEYALKMRGCGRADRKRIAVETLVKAGLEHLVDRPARLLSGGEQQLLAIARAWAVRPKVLLLDEPTAALDPGHTLAVERLIGEVREDGVKIILSTHDLGQARRLARDVLFLHRGELTAHAPVDDFFDSPRSDIARRFVNGEVAA